MGISKIIPPAIELSSALSDTVQATLRRKADLPSDFNPSYRGGHTADGPEYGAPLDDLSKSYPDDIYSAQGKRYYGHGGPEDDEAFRVINEVRGKPDADVTMYRAVPPDTPDEINSGDWVTTSKAYANNHGGEGWKVLRGKAKAKDLYSGNSPLEYGWHGALAGILAGGALGSEDSEAGILYGPLAKYADLKGLETAWKMQDKGKAPEDIALSTGWQETPEGAWGTLAPLSTRDFDLSRHIENLLGRDGGLGAGDGSFGTRLSEALRNFEFHENYPGVGEEVSLHLRNRMAERGKLVSDFADPYFAPEIHTDLINHARTAGHELEHLVSGLEGRAGGSNYLISLSNQQGLARDAAESLSDEIADLRASLVADIDTVPPFIRAAREERIEKLEAEVRRLTALADATYDDLNSMLAYRHNIGEGRAFELEDLMDKSVADLRTHILRGAPIGVTSGAKIPLTPGNMWTRGGERSLWARGILPDERGILEQQAERAADRRKKGLLAAPAGLLGAGLATAEDFPEHRSIFPAQQPKIMADVLRRELPVGAIPPEVSPESLVAIGGKALDFLENAPKSHMASSTFLADLLRGKGRDEAYKAAKTVREQPIEQTAYEWGANVQDKTGSATAAALTKALVELASPI
jgi:hypothetical protein